MMVKEDRLQIRATPATKQLLERAAEVAHSSVSAFVLGAAVTEAESVLAACRAVVVTALDRGARSWWEHLGFVPCEPDDPDALDLYLLTRDARATLEALRPG